MYQKQRLNEGVRILKYLAAQYIEFDADNSVDALNISRENGWELIEGDDYDPLEDVESLEAALTEIVLLLEKPVYH